jgi:hypothetical protein
MKAILMVLGIILIVIASAATPGSIVYGLYLWGAEDYELKIAAWEAAKTWISMLACVIPGLAFYFVSQA